MMMTSCVFTVYVDVSLKRSFHTIKASAHRTRPSAAACDQKSVLLNIASSVANRKWPDAAAGGRPLVLLQFCI